MTWGSGPHEPRRPSCLHDTEPTTCRRHPASGGSSSGNPSSGCPPFGRTAVRPRPDLVLVGWRGAPVFSKPGAQKVRNLRAHPSVMLALGDAEDDFDVGLLRGRAELLDKPTRDVLPAAHLDKYAARLASIGVSANEYAATYSQIIRMCPTTSAVARPDGAAERPAGRRPGTLDRRTAPTGRSSPTANGRRLPRRSRGPIVQPRRPRPRARAARPNPGARPSRFTGGLSAPAPFGVPEAGQGWSSAAGPLHSAQRAATRPAFAHGPDRPGRRDRRRSRRR